jgi:hypothetical protein
MPGLGLVSESARRGRCGDRDGDDVRFCVPIFPTLLRTKLAPLAEPELLLARWADFVVAGPAMLPLGRKLLDDDDEEDGETPPGLGGGGGDGFGFGPDGPPPLCLPLPLPAPFAFDSDSATDTGTSPYRGRGERPHSLGRRKYT